ncbi:dicarboxylate transporter/tellurite-resistance protein TehA [Chenggangzhangella methanolivorans]|uniref:Dicarboxylate transporter/tellurite-resistance protein TehA n=1 Tax=Chenggangzhangella methanolivorans TaxID=1437009 RepID=A0A9E6ULJ2_9HYPH|nr:dicarboxylate transporter/tellurite-resistance protein TehA [Chenggangzhangella methanolivorans]QZO00617.1 dicarboxylate transporter/tellurite-resistance protein TehA [Chenggangzhangella methanolivorans]
MFFGSVLGVGGLGNGWRAAHRLWGAPWVVGEALCVLAVAIWLTLLSLYALKWTFHRAEAKAELADPVFALLASLAPVATLIAAIAIEPIFHAGGLVMLAAGLAGATAFAAWSIGGLWLGGRAQEAVTPVLYMPTVGGGFVAGLACATYGWPTAGWMFFGAGLLSWMSMESVVLVRLLAIGLPVERRATLGVHLAPPAVAAVAWCALEPAHGVTTIGLALLGYGCFLALVMIRLVPWLREQAFSPAAWGYTFGVSALPLAAMRLTEKGAAAPAPEIAALAFVAANLIIGWIALRSLSLILRWARA